MKGYNISNDYDKLWELIHSGHRVLGWVWSRHEHYDCVEIKMVNERYMIGSRGIMYDGTEQTVDDFKRICEAWTLLYIMPDEQNKD